jgi:hypothetical protein
MFLVIFHLLLLQLYLWYPFSCDSVEKIIESTEEDIFVARDVQFLFQCHDRVFSHRPSAFRNRLLL